MINNQPTEIELVEQAHNSWKATPAPGTTLEQILDESYWMHVAYMLRPGDHIECVPENRQYFPRSQNSKGKRQRRQGKNSATHRYRPQVVGEWKTADFANSETAALTFDITDFVDSPGEYDVSLEFSNGASGVEVQSVSVVTNTEQILDECRSKFRLGRWSRWIEYWITVPEPVADAGQRLVLNAVLKGPSMDLPSDRRTTQGRILLRKSWRISIK